ncbi:MAG: RdgB/HAM1 family non-canonical purine NTP pyrophosphatase [Elusimicrobia bacterium]|nr:RdgB/HAM1 family non-canonical purine NTP pyrophosphatase [Elusimicrobiota bacterium]
MKLLLATGNAHKAREMREILGGLPVELKTLADLPGIPPVVEDGRTLEQNAVKKAIGPALASGLWTLSDDTGLEVDALGGRPGVYSARYAGPDCDFAANCRKLLEEMRSVPGPRRGAAFRTVVALASPEGMVQYREGRLEGRIAEAPAGTNGFGYDPVFYLPDEGRTLAELSTEEKNRLSHRSQGLQAILPLLKEVVK